MNEILINKLISNSDLSDNELYELISCGEYGDSLASAADIVRKSVYGNDVYIRGLIEFTNFCKNNCYYCGLRRDNKTIKRYRLTVEEILSCCDSGYELGFRTFVLQGGEDPYFTDERICKIVTMIKNEHPDCAVTLSIGEKSYSAYKAFKEAGAERYLLRHETANCEHYKKLHPKDMSFETRKEALYALKDIGFQVGSGFMVGSPYQTFENIIEDIRFLQELSPDMIGIGPYLMQSDTPFNNFKNGDYNLTLRLISILRLMFPKVLLPATTALGTIVEGGREKGIQAGANVVMPNLSPVSKRELYAIYDNKLSSGAESAQELDALKQKIESIGYKIVCNRGDAKTIGEIL